MTDQRDVLDVDGQDVPLDAVNVMANEGGLGGDRMLSQLLQPVPTPDGATFTKGIIPFAPQIPAGSSSAGPTNPATIQPGASAAYPITLMPFTAILGSTTPLSAEESDDPVDATVSQLNLRGLRSALFTALNNAGTAFGAQIPAAAFPSNTGDNRWDLIYAVLAVDQVTNTTGLIKPAADEAAAPGTVEGRWNTTVSFGVATGTEVGVVAPLPVDDIATGIFYIPLAAIEVLSGFVSGTDTFATNHIATLAPVLTLAQAVGAAPLLPASAATGSSLVSIWGTFDAGDTRPNVALPSTMVGGARRLILIEGGSSHPFVSGDVVDDSVNWNDRYFKSFASTGPADAIFGSGSVGASVYTPYAGPQTYSQSIAQPLVILPGAGASFSPGSAPDESFISGGVYSFYLACTNLPNGAVCTGASLYTSSGAVSTLQMGKRNLLTRIQTLGAATNVTGGPAATNSIAPPTTGDVIDTSTYAYFILATIGDNTASYFAPILSFESPAPASAMTGGQSYGDDSDELLGSMLGTAGSGFACYFSSEAFPQMGSGSALGLYVDLASGTLRLYKSGSPNLNLVVDLEATAPFDNV